MQNEKFDKNNNYKVLILDVDGVMTDGKFFYDENGKSFKIFGPDDSDALGIIKHLLEVRFVTGDRKGFKISKRRIVDDMGFKLDLVSTLKRLEWIEERYDQAQLFTWGTEYLTTLLCKELDIQLLLKTRSKTQKNMLIL